MAIGRSSSIPIGVGQALERASRVHSRTTVRQTWFAFGTRWLALFAGLLLLDIVFPMPVLLRWVGLALLVGYPLYVAYEIFRRREEFGQEHVARLIEEGHPELDNALINAVQFQPAMGTADDMQSALMQREIDRAEKAVSSTPVAEGVSRVGEQKALRWMLVALAIWCVGSILFPGAVSAVIPRLLAPWMDDVTPPFSLTKIQITPAGATVRYGGAVQVLATIGGPVPENMVLATKTDKGTWQELPLESIEPGKYGLTLSNLHEDTWFYARGGGARSVRYEIKVLLPPVMQSLEAHYKYPAYANKPEFTTTVSEEGIHGLRDTQVQLKLKGNRGLAKGEMLISYADGKSQTVSLSPDAKDPQTLIGNFAVTGSGKYKIALTSDDDQLNSEAAQGKIVLDHDEHPSVYFTEPEQEIVVTPTMKVRVGVEADDDIGIQKVNLHRVINNISDSGLPLYNDAPIKRVDKNLVMDMADLGVRPGDEITYYAEAFDNDPGHPNFAQSEPYKIKVLSEIDYKEALKKQRTFDQLKKEIEDINNAVDSLAAKQQELAEKMEKLQKALEKNPNDAKAKQQMEEARKEQAALQKEAEDLAKTLSDYAKSPSASDIESAIKKKVGELAQQIQKTAKESMKGAQSGDPKKAAEAAKKAANEISKASGQAQQQTGKATKDLEEVAPLFNDVERFKQLVDRQGQLVLHARQLQSAASDDPDTRAAMERIAAEQESIQKDLEQLQSDFRTHAAAAAKHFPKAADTATKIADEIGKRQIPRIMKSADDQFSASKGEEGLADAQKALSEMQAMIGKCNGGQGQCESEVNISLFESLGQSNLGDSLGSCLNPGVGPNNGSGTGSGSGGYQSPGSGKPGGNTNANGPTAYVMSTNSLAGPSGSRKMHSQNTRTGTAGLAPENVEVLKSQGKTPKAQDDADHAYPPEYRKMIRDYFVSVTKEKK